MRLGVCGMVPGDFRTITPQHLHMVRDMGLTGAAFHGVGDQLFDVQTADAIKSATSSLRSAWIYRSSVLLMVNASSTIRLISAPIPYAKLDVGLK